MSGLLALLDDVTAIAKVAAASIDDIATNAAKASAKAAGVVIDDAAVTPKYVTGFEAARELPIIGRIAMGSLRNKLFVLLPAALLLSAFAPWAIAPLLLVGGAYLCFEGAEKVLHWLRPHAAEVDYGASGEPAQLEEQKVKGAIKTDFILSAEIMTIALAEIPQGGVLMQAVTLAIVGTGITIAVYGTVALLVKADDAGLSLARTGRLAPTRALGRGLVRGMPLFMKCLSVLGTLAMLWVGGSIILHSLDVMGWPRPAELVYQAGSAVAALVPQAQASVKWLVTALIDGIIGLALGLALVPVAVRLVNPVLSSIARLFGRGKPSGGAAGH